MKDQSIDWVGKVSRSTGLEDQSIDWVGKVVLPFDGRLCDYYVHKEELLLPQIIWYSNCTSVLLPVDQGLRRISHVAIAC